MKIKPIDFSNRKEVIKGIKRINDRYKQIEKTYGIDNEIAQNYRKYMIALGGEENKQGQLVVSTKIASDLKGGQMQILDKLSQLRTQGDIAGSIRKSLLAEGYSKKELRGAEGKKLISQTFETRNKFHDLIEKLAIDFYNDDQRLKGQLQKNSGKLSLNEMIDMINKYGQQYNIVSPLEMPES